MLPVSKTGNKEAQTLPLKWPLCRFNHPLVVLRGIRPEATLSGVSMHYYQFNIGDYASHTSHLDEIEDIAYRRMLDYCYLNEIWLPESVEEVSRLIRMRTHCERIATVLREFWHLHDDGTWRHPRIERELQTFRAKSQKATNSARKRWENADANALRTQSEGNAKAMLTNNHKPITNKQMKVAFQPPTLDQVEKEMEGRTTDPKHEANRFLAYYQSNGWRVGKNPMKSWKAAVTNWVTRNQQPKLVNPFQTGVALRLTDTSWAD